METSGEWEALESYWNGNEVNNSEINKLYKDFTVRYDWEEARDNDVDETDRVEAEIIILSHNNKSCRNCNLHFCFQVNRFLKIEVKFLS